MKKLFSIFLAVVLIVSSFSVTCFAESPVKLSLNSETDTVYAGDEFFVKLMISDNSKMSGAAIDINYDKNKLEYISGSFGGILDDSATKSVKNINGDKAKVRFTYLAPSSSVTSQGVLVTVKFKALENASGKTDLTISVPNPGDFVAQDLTRLSYSVENAKITIIGSPTETESVLQSETETQPVESSSTETTTKPVVNNDADDDEDINKTIMVVVIAGVAILFAVALLTRKPKSKKKKRKK